jgi:hypothetical protein
LTLIIDLQLNRDFKRKVSALKALPKTCTDDLEILTGTTMVDETAPYLLFSIGASPQNLKETQISSKHDIHLLEHMLWTNHSQLCDWQAFKNKQYGNIIIPTKVS